MSSSRKLISFKEASSSDEEMVVKVDVEECFRERVVREEENEWNVVV
jgi:hypothetical protein